MTLVPVLAVVVVPAVFGALHWYLYRRLIRQNTSRGARARRAGAALFVVGPLLAGTAVVGGFSSMPMAVERVVAWPGYLWLAVFLYLLLGVLAGEVVRPLLNLWLTHRHRASAVVVDPATPAADLLSRRLFVSRAIAGVAATAAVGVVGHGTHGVLNGPSVKRSVVPLAKLSRAHHGFRIAVVSDIHLGPLLGRRFAQRVTDTINGTQPDLIVVVGDVVDGDVDELSDAVEPLARLRARHGTYFVTGNHEYISGADQWVEKVREMGWRPLENARAELPGFTLAGVNDFEGVATGRGPDFTKALGDRDPALATLLLAHQPTAVHEAVRHGVDLQLSGHTHGGQLWPFTYVAEAANPTVAGLERYGDTQLYVSRGAGAWGPPTRVGAPSDVTIVELASRQA
ncbi:metallophosphoesterase [Lentzea cavernae]|uniref:metallophosphoesterase n=1 Tax=Lentzea cavernae TaxID=2020703 RepID=UPI001747E40C|nr:metallophosphoesterase [Lentzea cavernae]